MTVIPETKLDILFLLFLLLQQYSKFGSISCILIFIDKKSLKIRKG